MRTSKFSKSQSIDAMRQVEGGDRADEVCRKLGISTATFYHWKKKDHGMRVSQLRRLKESEQENGKLKQLVADWGLDKHLLQEVIKKTLCSQCSAESWPY